MQKSDISMFKEIKANKRSQAHRKLVFGVGVNDAEYIVQSVVNGNRLMCPYYQKWTGMLMRCYSDAYHKRYPTYIGCSVSKEWLIFSAFKVWMLNQDWEGKSLDKDLLVQDNKIYSPSNCIFVTQRINNLLCDNKVIRGDCPTGVSFCNTNKKYIAKISVDGKTKFLGYHETPALAFNSYKSAKYGLVKEIAINQIEPLRSALLNFKIKL
jgi:hypothetical protein